ncbi:helix-turn-helix domain-containing protein [Companilactobacillus huachuanensis]|uniref:Helix-turn-helix domain-containing protein n=1 Tax=Companilactobacillus huachuanensis TaxID=2559914 RepID=A0ABW1RMU9_9LACO|nr:helix-turn-helix domain-containing protein [Companilactobacillus huachuanensis]
MLKEDLLLKSIKCTTIDQLTKLIGNYLEQTVLIIDEKNNLISSNLQQVPSIDAGWLTEGNLKKSFLLGQTEYIRNTINTFSLNNWYLFVTQSKGFPLSNEQLQLSIKIINNFNDRYSVNPDQSELNSLFAKMLDQVNSIDTLAFNKFFPTKIVCVIAMSKKLNNNQANFMKELQTIVAPMPLTEDSEQNLVFVVAESKLDALTKQLTEIGKKYQHYFFVSESYREISQTQEFLKICKQAAKIADKFNEIRVVNHTLKYNIYIILNQMSNIELLKNTMCSQLLFLQHYDKEHHSELFETLFEYLESDCKLTYTADKMHLHRNSLSKRLSRINDLISIDYENPDKIFGLRLSYRIFNYLEY